MSDSALFVNEWYAADAADGESIDQFLRRVRRQADATPLPAMWESIHDAYGFVLAGKAKRLDGAGWSVYSVGSNVVRVDLRVEL